MNALVSTKIDTITKILKENQVKRAYFFGSVCNNNFTKNSDIDMLIGFEDNLDPIIYGDNYFRILEALQNLLHREIDLLTEKSLQNPYFIKVINSTKEVIYE